MHCLYIEIFSNTLFNISTVFWTVGDSQVDCFPQEPSICLILNFRLMFQSLCMKTSLFLFLANTFVILFFCQQTRQSVS